MESVSVSQIASLSQRGALFNSDAAEGTPHLDGATTHLAGATMPPWLGFRRVYSPPAIETVRAGKNQDRCVAHDATDDSAVLLPSRHRPSVLLCHTHEEAPSNLPNYLHVVVLVGVDTRPLRRTLSLAG